MEKKVIVIGAAIMDIMGFPNKQLISYDSVPGEIHTGNGGVGRNIAENLLRLGVTTSFISAFGGDAFALQLQRSITDLKGEISNSVFTKKGNSALHLAIMDDKNDMVAGIAAMDIIQAITPEFLATKKEFLLSGAKIVVETNISQKSLSWISNHIKKEHLSIDLVSIEMAQKAKKIIGAFGTVKANRKEAAIFLERPILSEDDARLAAKILLKKGCQNIFITMGAEGVLSCNRKKCIITPAPKTQVASTTGAGDAFMAGVVLGQMKALPIETCTAYGMAAALITLKSKETVSSLMNQNYLKEKIDQYFNL